MRPREAEHVRESQVKRLLAALQQELRAVDQMEKAADGDKMVRQALARLLSVKRNSTDAEIREAYRRAR